MMGSIVSQSIIKYFTSTGRGNRQRIHPAAGLTVRYESEQNRANENLEISLKDLKPGKYLLQIQGVDAKSGNEVEREVLFEIKKAANRKSTAFSSN